MSKGPRLITLPAPSPSEAAELELAALSSRPEFQSEIVFGGPIPPAMKKHNRERREAYEKAKLDIIAKYGLFDEYLQPLLEDEQRLESELASVQAQIRGLIARRKK